MVGHQEESPSHFLVPLNQGPPLFLTPSSFLWTSVFKTWGASDLPTEPGKIFKGPTPTLDKILLEGLTAWSTTTWKFENCHLKQLLKPLHWPGYHQSPHALQPLQRSHGARCKVLTQSWAVPGLAPHSPLPLLGSHTQRHGNIHSSSFSTSPCLFLPAPHEQSYSVWTQVYFPSEMFPDMLRKGKWSLDHTTCSSLY